MWLSGKNDKECLTISFLYGLISFFCWLVALYTGHSTHLLFFLSFLIFYSLLYCFSTQFFYHVFFEFLLLGQQEGFQIPSLLVLFLFFFFQFTYFLGRDSPVQIYFFSSLFTDFLSRDLTSCLVTCKLFSIPEVIYTLTFSLYRLSLFYLVNQ